MKRLIILAAAGTAGLASFAPAAAQSPYQYPYPLQGYAYPQQGYAYPQQGQGGISQIIGQLLGNRYQTNDRVAVERCASAAMAQASAQYRPAYGQGYGYQGQGYGNGYGYGNQGYYGAQMRVTAITDVRRRNNSVRVSGLLDSQGGARAPYGSAYGYQGQGYAAQGDLTFRCNVDYRGAVTGLRIGRNQAAYRRGY
jgi:hypothetical protein